MRYQRPTKTYDTLVDMIRSQPWYRKKEDLVEDELDKIDEAFSSAEAAEPGTGGPRDAIPKGTEVAVVITATNPTQVGDNQTRVCKVTFEVMEGPHKTAWIWHDLWVTVNNVKYLKRDLELLGWKGDKLSQIMDPKDRSLYTCGVIAVTDEPEEYIDKNEKPQRKTVISYFKEHYEWVPPQGVTATTGEAPPEGVDDPSIPF